MVVVPPRFGLRAMTGLCPVQVRREIVTPVLELIGLGGDAAGSLLTGTALAETGLAYIRQVTDGGPGPALGLWQMEPFTHDDIWATFLPAPRLAGLRRHLLLLRGQWPAGAAQMASNMAYACAMARVKYYRAPDPLPAATDAVAMCRMWKRIYNTSLGAGEADPRHVALFQQAIGT